MRDRILESRVSEAGDRFIGAIDEEDILLLASSYHNDDPCSFFQSPVRGTSNICFFVQFSSHKTKKKTRGRPRNNVDRWVVRVPLSPCLGVVAHDKLESEVAVMMYVIISDSQVKNY